MGYWSRRELLTGAIGGAGSAGVLGYSWRWCSTRRDEIRLRPITLVNGNTDTKDVFVRIYTADGYEFHDTLTLEAAETDTANAEGNTTTRTLNGPWEETPRRYALTVVYDARGGSYMNEEIQEEIAEDDPDSNIAEVLISVNSSMFSAHITAPGGNII